MEKNTEQVPGERDKEITVQFEEGILERRTETRDKPREAGEGLTPRGDIGLPEAALEDQSDVERNDGSDFRQTSDMNSPGDSQSEDEGVPGGFYAQDERGEGVEKFPTWDTGNTDEGTENSERIRKESK